MNPDHSSPLAEAWSFCEGILPDVSRSFALIIPRCPAPIDRALCVAYLLCRIADTVEDEPDLGRDDRERLYGSFLAAVDSPHDATVWEAFRQAWPLMPEGAYGRLVERCDLVLQALAALPTGLTGPIRECVREMVAGMRDLRPVECRDGLSFLCRDLTDLDAYCHIVAGTVGIMSTRLFEWRLGPAGFKARGDWQEDGRRLGLGLQMTNILKDCRVDAERGVSFIPPRYVDLSDGRYQLKPGADAELISHTIGHLDAGMQYIRAVPAGETGIRTFLLGSLLPAIATLEVTAPGCERQPKISRAKMGEIFDCISRHTGDDPALNAWYTTHRDRTLAALVPG